MTLLVAALTVASFVVCALALKHHLFHPAPLEEHLPAETPARRHQITRGEVVPLHPRHGPFIRPHGFDREGEFIERHPRAH